MANFPQLLTELSVHDRFDFSFRDGNLSKCQWIFTKLDLCIYIVEIWFEIACGQFCHFLTELSARDTSVFWLLDSNLKISTDFYQT